MSVGDVYKTNKVVHFYCLDANRFALSLVQCEAQLVIQP